MSSSPLAAVEMAPRDPILGVTEAFVADTHPNKVNLGVGVYYDDNGKVPVLECVRLAEKKMAESVTPRNYLPIDGMAAYNKAVQSLVFGADSEVVWVLSLQEDGKELQHGLFAGKGRVLQTVLTDLSKAASNNRAQGLLHESDGGLFPL